MNLPLLPRGLSALAAGTGLFLAGAFGLGVPAFADDGAAGASDGDQSVSASSDSSASEPTETATPAPTETATPEPVVTKKPRPKFTPAPAPVATKKPAPTFTPQPAPTAQPTTQPTAPAASSDGQDTAGQGSASTTTKPTAPASTGTTTTDTTSNSTTTTDKPAPSKSLTQSGTVKTPGTTTTTEATPSAEPTAQQSADPKALTASANDLSASASTCDATTDPTNPVIYMPVTVAVSSGQYPFDNEQITWSGLPSGATTVIVTVAGPSPQTTTQAISVDLSVTPTPTSTFATGLANGDYTVQAIANVGTDAEGGCFTETDARTEAASVPFTIKKTVPSVSAPATVSWYNPSPIVVNLAGFMKDSTIKVVVTDSQGNDIADSMGCSIEDVKIVNDDGTFQIVQKSFNGNDCFMNTGTYTITATSSGSDGATASTTFKVNQEPWVNPLSVTIDDNKLHVGDTTYLRGSGYTAGAVVTFYWTPNSGNQFELGSAVADEDGNVVFEWVVGDDVNGLPIDTGTGTVYAVDDEGNYAELENQIAILTETKDPVINVNPPDITVNPTPVEVSAPVTNDSRTFPADNRTFTTENKTFNYDNRAFTTTNNVTNNKVTNNKVTNNRITNNAKPATKVAAAQVLPAAGSTSGGSGGTLAATGANLGSLSILIACLLGGGALAVLTRRNGSRVV